MDTVITIMGKEQLCAGKYLSGINKGKPCRQGGAVRIDTIPFCGAHAKAELRMVDGFYGLSIDEISDMATDKDKACALCNRYYTKEVEPGLYQGWIDNYFYGPNLSVEKGASMRVCASCYSDITACIMCGKAEATEATPSLDGDAKSLYNCCFSCHKDEMERKDATEVFQQACDDFEELLIHALSGRAGDALVAKIIAGLKDHQPLTD